MNTNTTQQTVQKLQQLSASIEVSKWLELGQGIIITRGEFSHKQQATNECQYVNNPCHFTSRSERNAPLLSSRDLISLERVQVILFQPPL